MWKALTASSIGVVLCVGVAVHELMYHQEHTYAPGVSGVLVVLALGAACGCAAAGLIAWEKIKRQEEETRRIFAQAARGIEGQKR